MPENSPNRQQSRPSTQVFLGIVVGTVIFLILAAVFCVPSSSNTQSTSPVMPRSRAVAQKEVPESLNTPVIEISAAALYVEYDRNEIAADEKYRDKLLQVFGRIEDFGKDILDAPYVALRAKGFGCVQCMFDSTNAKVLVRYRKGNSVIVRGFCKGKTLGNVLLSNCVVVLPEQAAAKRALYPAVSGRTLKDSLLAHYPLDGDANDMSGNDRHGKVYGATPTADRFGNKDGAYYFDGKDDYIALQDTANLRYTNGLTVTAWIRAEKMGTECRIISKVPARKSSSFTLAILSGDLGFYARGWKRCSDVSLNQWIHVIVAWDGVSLSFFKDGKFVKSFECNRIPTNDLDIEIGSSTGVPRDHFFCGDIDEVAIYDRALSEREVQGLYSQTMKE